ncbi:hypothetical protein [Nostoc sp.]
MVKSIKSDEGTPDFQAMPQDLAFLWNRSTLILVIRLEADSY